MNKLWGFLSVVAVLALLAGCTSNVPAPISEYAPITDVSGVLPGASGGYGRIYSTISLVAGPDPILEFNDPSYEFAIDGDGRFNVALPATVDPAATRAPCGQPGHAIVGSIYTYDLPLSDSKITSSDGTGRYRYRSEDGYFVAWYSPKDTLVKCQMESGAFFPQPHDYDVRLKAGWNAVNVHEDASDPDVGVIYHYRIGAPDNGRWMPLGF